MARRSLSPSIKDELYPRLYLLRTYPPTYGVWLGFDPIFEN
jgi:hypothetical protein